MAESIWLILAALGLGLTILILMAAWVRFLWLWIQRKTTGTSEFVNRPGISSLPTVGQEAPAFTLPSPTHGSVHPSQTDDVRGENLRGPRSIRQPFPEDRWFDSDPATWPFDMEPVPLQVGRSSDLDVTVGWNGPDIMIWTPSTTWGVIAGVFLGVMLLGMGVMGGIVTLVESDHEQFAVSLLLTLFVIAGGIGLLIGLMIWKATRVTFVFDRAAATVTARSRRRSFEFPLDSIESVEFILTGKMKRFGRQGLGPSIEPGVSGNASTAFRMEHKGEIAQRKNLSHWPQGEILKKHGEELAALLDVPFLDAADPVKFEQAITRYIGKFGFRTKGESGAAKA